MRPLPRLLLSPSPYNNRALETAVTVRARRSPTSREAGRECPVPVSCLSGLDPTARPPLGRRGKRRRLVKRDNGFRLNRTQESPVRVRLAPSVVKATTIPANDRPFGARWLEEERYEVRTLVSRLTVRVRSGPPNAAGALSSPLPDSNRRPLLTTPSRRPLDRNPRQRFSLSRAVFAASPFAKGGSRFICALPIELQSHNGT